MNSRVNESTAPAARPKGDLQKLFEVIDQANAAEDAAAGNDGRSTIDQGGKGSGRQATTSSVVDRPAKLAGPARPGGVGPAVSVGGLWG